MCIVPTRVTVRPLAGFRRTHTAVCTLSSDIRSATLMPCTTSGEPPDYGAERHGARGLSTPPASLAGHAELHLVAGAGGGQGDPEAFGFDDPAGGTQLPAAGGVGLGDAG